MQGDQCLDAPCYQTKVAAHIDRETAARPELVTIETAWRSPKEQRPGALQRNQYRELDTPDNPDAEPPCPTTKTAIIVYGRNAGRTLAVCTDNDCSVHNPHIVKQRAADPPPAMPTAAPTETVEEAAQREAEHTQRMAEYEAEQKRKEEERKAEFERQQKQYEAEQTKREKQRKARVVTFEHIIEQAPATFNAAQTRTFLRLLILMDPYSYLEEVASHFAMGDENTQQSDNEIVLAALDSTADENLNGLALRIVLTHHIGIPREDQPDLLIEAKTVFAPKPDKKPKQSTPKKPTPIKAAAKATKKATVTRPKKAIAA